MHLVPHTRTREEALFGEFSKSPLWYPAPTRARRHPPAFGEFCKACTRPLLRENGRRGLHRSPQPDDLRPGDTLTPPEHRPGAPGKTLLENSPKAFTPIDTRAPPPAVCLAACDPRPVTSRYREPPYPTDAGGGGHRPTPGRHQVCTCTFAGNTHFPQVTPHPIPAGALTTPG